MADSPLASNPYEVLGGRPNTRDDELKRAYRKRLREAHPDTGGSSAEFDRVQQAWQRVGTPSARAAYDTGVDAGSGGGGSWAQSASGGARRRGDSRPNATSHGHPGGYFRERYLDLMREWVGRGVELDDPYDPQLVRRAPREIRHLLAAAVAEEKTATALFTLGMGFTLWHDVLAGPGTLDKIDHIVLGPTGLWAVLSEDWGGPVKVKRGEVIGEGLAPGERPLHDLAVRAKVVAREAKVRFSALVVVVDDEHAPQSLTDLKSIRGAQGLLVERSRLVNLIRTGLPGVGVGGTDLFEVRTRIQHSVRYVY